MNDGVIPLLIILCFHLFIYHLSKSSGIIIPLLHINAKTLQVLPYPSLSKFAFPTNVSITSIGLVSTKITNNLEIDNEKFDDDKCS